MNIVNKSEGPSFSPKIGIFSGELLTINPTLKELKEIYSDKVDKEPVYTGTDKNGKDWTMLHFLFKTKDSVLLNYKLFLGKEINTFQPKEGEALIEFVNQVGDTRMVTHADELKEQFTHFKDKNGIIGDKNYREAHKGEGELYALLKFLINNDPFNVQTDILCNFKKLMSGDVSEIKNLIGTENLGKVIGMSSIEVKEVDGKKAISQNCVNGAWLSDYRGSYGEVVAIIESNSWEAVKNSKNPKEYNIRNFQYKALKSKHCISFTLLHDFVEEEHVQAGDGIITHSEPATGKKEEISTTDWSQ